MGKYTDTVVLTFLYIIVFKNCTFFVLQTVLAHSFLDTSFAEPDSKK
jgi:hypothetical protein